MLFKFQQYSAYTSYVLLGISLVICIFKSGNLSNSLKRYCLCLILYAITAIVISLWPYGKNNLPLLHMYTFLEFIVWTFFYKSILPNKKIFNKYYISIIALLLIANTLFLEPIWGFNSNAKTLVQIILIGYAVYYLFENYGKVDFSKNLNNAIMLINFAVIIYYSGSLFIFMFSKILLNNQIDQQFFWNLNGFLLVIFHTLSLVSIYKVAFNRRLD